MDNSVAIGDYLIEQIMALGVRHVFGVPGDYVLSFFKKLSESPLKLINTCDEQGAGFAADAYARLSGLGVVCVTYGVGGLKVANTTAQAFAEKVPVLVISGAPGNAERYKNPLLHHKSNQFETQRKIFEQITVAAVELSNPETALAEIDRVLATILREKRPGYIELPRDMVNARVPRTTQDALSELIFGEPEALEEALTEAVKKINASRQPVVLVGEECYRFGLQDLAIQLAEKIQAPLAVTLLGKSAVPETHPLYMGVYAGALSDEDVRAYFENSDCLILAGVLLTDMNLGVYTARLDPNKTIYIANEHVTIAHHSYEGVGARTFLPGLLRCDIQPRVLDWVKKPQPAISFTPTPGAKVAVSRFFEQINAFLDCDMVVISDVGDALFGAIDLVTCRAAQFLSPAFYASLGFAVPGSIGAQMCSPNLRPLVLVGDGAFQMTGMEISTAARYGLDPIIVVMNNQGYATERPMIDGPFNDILPWNDSRLPEVLGCGIGFEIETEDQLQAALQAAHQHTGSFSILDVKLDPKDISLSLKQLTYGLAKRT